MGKLKLSPALAPTIAAKLSSSGRRRLEQAKKPAAKGPSPEAVSLAQGGAKAPAPSPSGAKKPASKPASKPAAKPVARGAKPAATQPTVPSAQGGERRLLLQEQQASLAENKAGAPAPAAAKHATKKKAPAAEEQEEMGGDRRRALLQAEEASLAEKKEGATPAPAPAAAKAGSKKKAPSAAEQEEKEGDRRRLAQMKGQMLDQAPAASLGERRRRLAQAMMQTTFGAAPAAAPFPAAPAATTPLKQPTPAPASPEFGTFASGPSAEMMLAEQKVAGAPAAAPGAFVGDSVYNAVSKNPKFSVAKSLIDKAGLAGALGPQFGGTAFLPDDAAFATYAKEQGTDVKGLEAKNPNDIKKVRVLEGWVWGWVG